MRTFTIGKALAVALLLAPLLAHAAGLGRLTVQSSIGQPLSAEIDLVAVRGDEASGLNVRLASPDAYQQANLQYNAGMTGIKLSIERRANGQSFIKVAGNRPVNEPFVDLLIELSWSGGKLMREYTALLDPPGYGQQSAAAAPVAPPAVPESRPITAPVAPAPVARSAAPAAAAPSAQEYGPIARGETLGKIAASLKPEGVSLEQMLVGLYRSNPDAFIRKNLNLVKSGRILRVPDAQELAAISPAEAMQEYRTQVADWRAYSARVADTAGQAPEGGSTARGRITARVDDPAAAEGKDVVRLSKGEPGKGDKPLTGAAQARALQEELVARNKELAEARERIAQLEKTIKDTQKLVELKSPGMAAAQQKPEVAKSEGPTPEMKGADAPPTETRQDLTAAPPPADKPVVEQPPAPKPKPKPVAPPPPPEPGVMDMVMDNLPLLGGGAAVLVLGGLGVAAMRRRRARGQDIAELEPVAPTLGPSGAAAAVAGAAATTVVAAAAPAVDDVDPVAEAEVYIAYGRDGQAEEILKEAMHRNPSREEVQVKLAEVYAARKDAAAFGAVAESLYARTGGTGDNWVKVAALGYAMDSTNPLYEAGKDVVPSAAIPDSATGTDLDFDLGDGLTTPDIALDADTAGQTTQLHGVRELAAAADAGAPLAAPVVPDFTLDSTISGMASDIAADATPTVTGEASTIDFNFELPPVDSPAPVAAAPAAAPATDAGFD
ncbi:MAG: hypothetical protein H6R21_1390, partial [Proteobacteria bacterium]|nr:hypothetical protein [Pseudomonadota bacterium]